MPHSAHFCIDPQSNRFLPEMENFSEKINPFHFDFITFGKIYKLFEDRAYAQKSSVTAEIIRFPSLAGTHSRDKDDLNTDLDESDVMLEKGSNFSIAPKIIKHFKERSEFLINISSLKKALVVFFMTPIHTPTRQNLTSKNFLSFFIRNLMICKF